MSTPDRTGFFLEPQDADSLKQPQRPDTIRIGCIFRHFETDADMALCGKVVDLVRLCLLHDPQQIGRVDHIAIVEDEARMGFMWILIDVLDTTGVKRRGSPLDTMHRIAFAQKQFGQIGTILTGHPSDKRGFCHFSRRLSMQSSGYVYGND